MHDPFPLPRPEFLVPYVEKISEYLALRTLPLHYHELIIAFTLYHATYKFLSPAVSSYLFPRIYPSFNARTKMNWDVHVVSFVQSTLICILALWVMWADTERNEMNTTERTHGYTGAWRLLSVGSDGHSAECADFRNRHAVPRHLRALRLLLRLRKHPVKVGKPTLTRSQRPFVNYYATTFILYELSSPFLNIHWFCDKLNMTGSTIQFVNGIVLLITFFSCRILWGSYMSINVFGDVWHAYKAGPVILTDPQSGKLNSNTVVGNAGFKHDVMQFADGQYIPLWLAATYLASNLILNGLNWFWFNKMIETLRKRFEPPLGTRQPDTKTAVTQPVLEDEKVLVEGTHVATPGVSEEADPIDYLRAGSGAVPVKMEKSNNGTHLEVSASEVRSRTSIRRLG
jgi:hypothetical protein